MTNKQINIAIAEACGWNIADYGDESARPFGRPPANENLTTICNWKYVNGVGYYEIKDYSQDLNAMHEAEKTLLTGDKSDVNDLRYIYVRTLYSLVPLWNQPAMATARERAEAFLRTIGKWEESES